MMKRAAAIQPAFLTMEKALVHKGGKRGVEEYNRCISELSVSVPKSDRKTGHYVECLLDMWEALQNLEPEAPADGLGITMEDVAI